MKKVYKSKVDTWLVLLLVVIFAFSIVTSLLDNFSWGNFSVVMCTTAIVFNIILGFSYVIEENSLKIKLCSWTLYTIDIMSIKDISDTKSILSSPAASLDRIRIKYGKYDEVIISPKDKIAFINDLKSINKDIKA